MKEIFVPGRPDYKSIKMDTRRGNPIENHQVYDFSPSEMNYFKGLEKELEKRYGKDVYPRNKPNAIYNCHGMTFGCGRTTIGNESVGMILKDDGYCEVDLDNVLPGDVVIYYTDDGEAVHSGVVGCVHQIGNLKVPRVVSKWGKYKEFYHHESSGPYTGYTRRYWRIKR